MTDVWDVELLRIMRFEAESLADFQQARVKITNRTRRYRKLYPDWMPRPCPEHMPDVAGCAKCTVGRPCSVAHDPSRCYDSTCRHCVPSMDKEYSFFGAIEANETAMYKTLVEDYKMVAPIDVLEWQASTPGLGPEMLARFIGLIGNPRLATPMIMIRGKKGEFRDPLPDPMHPEHMRTLRELWSYSGIGDADRVLTKDMSQVEFLARGRRRARAVLYNIANSIVRAQSGKNSVRATGLGYLYEATRMRYETRLHDEPCIRCGTPGKPAQPGTAWKDAHKDQSAKRVVAKRVVKDLWQRS